MLIGTRVRRVARRVWREEDGIGYLWAVLFIPVAIVLTAFVLDVANWFEHRRHLQLQVDSAALAAGGQWVFTRSSAGGSTCSDGSIEGEALHYAGDKTRLPSTFNLQVSNENNVHVLFNSPSYWATAADSGLENTLDAGGPCANSYIDVKATDDKPPVVLRNLFAGLTPVIHAHARVNFFVADTLSGGRLLPIALPDPTPKHAYAYFVNETTGAALGGPIPLYYTGVSSNGVDLWSSVDMSQSPPVYNTVTIPSMPTGNVGVRIALSGHDTNNACGQPLVTCYDTPSGNPAPNGTTPLFGIDNIRTFNASATPSPSSPLAAMTAYGAKLTSADCTNPYWPSADCSVRLHVRVAFQSPGITPANVTMKARVDGQTQNNRQYNMAPGNSADCPAIPPSPTGSLCYESTDDIPLTGAGWHTIDVAWSDHSNADSLTAGACNQQNNCDDTGTPGLTVQRVFFGTSTSAGPLRMVDVMDNSPTPVRAEQPGSTAFHSYAQGTTNVTLGVQIGIQQAFATAPVNSPPVTLRFSGGGQSQAVDCNPKNGPYANQYQAQYGTSQYNAMTQLDGELQFGCLPDYTKWDGATACVGAGAGTLYPGNTTQLWASTQPWTCAAASTGTINSAIGPGLNARILGNKNANTCPPLVWDPNHKDANGDPDPIYGIGNGHNNWNPKGVGGVPLKADWSPADLPADDPRIVFVFLTPFGTFATGGNETYPVTRFATFYITGWQSNGGNGNPCQGNGDDPANSAEIVGHFMTYAVPDGGDSTHHNPCDDPQAIDVCIAQLTQ